MVMPQALCRNMLVILSSDIDWDHYRRFRQYTMTGRHQGNCKSLLVHHPKRLSPLGRFRSILREYGIRNRVLQLFLCYILSS